MKINSKKIISIIATLTIGLTIFSGCGKKAEVDKAADSGAKDAKKTLVVGVSTEYYPWCFKENDQSKGFEIDVWNEIGKRAGYEIEYQTAKFSGLVGMLDAGKIDTVAHQMSTTEERKAKYDFSDTYAYSKYKFVVPSDNASTKIEDFKGKKVGCVLGGNGEKTLKDLNEKYNLGLDIVTFDGVPMEKDVEIGRIDAAWLSEVKAKTTIEQGKLNLKIADIDTGVYEINQYPFRKEEASKEIIETVNKTIKEMHADGTFTKLSNQWFQLDTTKETN
ncbi:MAG: transporter substrate-binding domain-containing protein [Clostridium sp.]|uniref:transporter substrate-binding domain-containing protein n=1 Tax=Clostridium sp. TaxID=1506 RepID=UPI00306597BD